MRALKYLGLVLLLISTSFFTINAYTIYQYSTTYSDAKSDVAIVLGAGTADGQPSPIFKERLNHAKYLYETNKVDKLILTGGFGKNANEADSQIARRYLIRLGLPEAAIFVEDISQYTFENLIEAHNIMQANHLETCLLVSDPLHMKRSMALASQQGMSCQPSPTTTSMYRSFIPKLKSLLYETFYYSLGKMIGKN